MKLVHNEKFVKDINCIIEIFGLDVFKYPVKKVLLDKLFQKTKLV